MDPVRLAPKNVLDATLRQSSGAEAHLEIVCVDEAQDLNIVDGEQDGVLALGRL
eukprot:CAMPEP_0202831338 /NCGR_PEP_ID=MMETSP1389-20130828/16793_1 /ASSEMBLY_ACC=CAM_ASM_000865 /TAXON_ID=302021 /ORGANISM="Rhodomonas sp., Strain CCMP768" /LENGTH=53 /DNA_ID=CAMNT_0049505081 /DNA_START=120 /DNA_END=278 /DNA_ORIENTATION=+